MDRTRRKLFFQHPPPSGPPSWPVRKTWSTKGVTMEEISDVTTSLYMYTSVMWPKVFEFDHLFFRALRCQMDINSLGLTSRLCTMIFIGHAHWRACPKLLEELTSPILCLEVPWHLVWLNETKDFDGQGAAVEDVRGLREDYGDQSRVVKHDILMRHKLSSFVAEAGLICHCLITF